MFESDTHIAIPILKVVFHFFDFLLIAFFISKEGLVPFGFEFLHVDVFEPKIRLVHTSDSDEEVKDHVVVQLLLLNIPII